MLLGLAFDLCLLKLSYGSEFLFKLFKLCFLLGMSSTFNVPAKEINEFVADDSMIRVNATATVDETKQLVVANHVINVDKPNLTVTIKDSKVKPSIPFDCEVSFTNPIDKELTGCELKYDGSIINYRYTEQML